MSIGTWVRASVLTGAALASPLGLPHAAGPVPLHARQAVVETRDTTTAARGWLGMELVSELPRTRMELPVESRIRVEGVALDGPAHRAGVRAGDLVIRIDGDPASEERLRRMAAGLEPGGETRLLLQRGEQVREVRLRAAEHPFWSAEGRAADSLADAFRREAEAREGAYRQLRRQLDSLQAARGEGSAEGRPVVIGPAAWGGDRSPAILVLGRSVVAGAELAPLNRGLARYFNAEAGVLVLSVVDGSPAARAGLRVGDVVVRAGNEAVADVPQLRAAIGRAYRDPPVLLRVVRDRDTLSLELSR